ncbi:MAG: LCP family protein [Clostridia bacterium]|nr:LCP family protein [Clostridia bacterium]
MQFGKSLLSLCLIIVLVCSCLPALADANSGYLSAAPYILEPPALPERPNISHDIVTFLMLGVDFGIQTVGTDKIDIRNCHTDSVILIVLDQTDQRVSLISFPRDTMTYVVGVRGLYKLNNAFNCADSFEAGIGRTMDTVGFLMGGIRPDHYVLLTPSFVQTIGDAIGGVDLNVEMSYTGQTGVRYAKGLQHLNGLGIMDYARARKNATVNPDDYGRTARQRQLMTALYQKLIDRPELLETVLDTIAAHLGSLVFSDMTVYDMRFLLPIAEALSRDAIWDYAMTGELAMAMKFWNFSFLDQAKRQSIIQEVYGVQVEKLPYYKHAYANYLYQHGFEAIRVLMISEDAAVYAEALGTAGKEAQALREAQEAVKAALSEVREDLSTSATNQVTKKQNALKLAVKQLRDKTGYPEKLSWAATLNWYEDPLINEYSGIDWR